MEELKKIILNNYTEENYDRFLNIINDLQTSSNFDYELLNIAKEMIKIIIPIKIDIDTILASLMLPFMRKNADLINILEDNLEAKGLINSVLALENVDYTNNEAETENIRAMLVAIAKDIRVIVIKLADVYVRALYLKEDNSYSKMLHYEIKEIYSPLAARLGLTFLRNKLNDLNFIYYQKNEYKKLSNKLKKNIDNMQEIISNVQNYLNDILSELNIKGKVYGRIKTISSIYNKLKEKNLNLNQIYDIVALRVCVSTVNECYAVLGAVHTKYVPLEGRFKDYIAKPKANGYQSLHTTITIGDLPIEIQIRTNDMHNHAEYGIAAHWLYKEHKSKANNLDEKLIWIRKLLENNEKTTASELIDELKTDVYADSIFVQSPQGKILELVENSTPIDFAYLIHSEVGNKCVGAKVNGKIVPLYSTLNNGDVVEIIISNTTKGPSRDWLKICKTASAKSKINAFFKKEMKEENIKKGKSILEQAVKNKSIAFNELFKEAYLVDIYEKYGLKNLDEIYAAVGYGSLTSNQVMNKLMQLYNLEHNDNLKESIVNINKTETIGEIRELTDVMIKFAKCCNPIPGDEIVGFVSRGNGVTIHRKDCVSLHQYESERIMELHWGQEEDNHNYIAGLRLLVLNKTGMLASITNKINENKINITYINTEILKYENAIINIGINVKNRNELQEIQNKLSSIENVLDVTRGN